MDLIKIYKKNEIIKDYVNIYFDDEKSKYNLKKKISYKILHIIGNGVYGVVYKADCLDNCSIVALKQTYQKNARIFKEIEIMKKLKHPNIVKLKHAFYTNTSNGVYVHMVMEYGNIDLATSLYYITLKDSNEIINSTYNTTKNNNISNNSTTTNNINNNTNNNINDNNNNNTNNNINDNNNNNTNNNINDNNNNNNNSKVNHSINNSHKNEDDELYSIKNEKCDFNYDDTKIELRNSKNRNVNNFNNINEINNQNKEKIINVYDDNDNNRISNNTNVNDCNNLINNFHVNVLNESINNICPSHNLSEYIKKNFLNQNQIKIYLYQLIRATLYLHSLRITHRDIKPQNILIFLNNANNNISNKSCDNEKCVICLQNSFEHKIIMNNKNKEKNSQNNKKKINENVITDININNDLHENLKKVGKVVNDNENQIGRRGKIENVNKKKNKNSDLKNFYLEDNGKSAKSDYTYSNEESIKNKSRVDDLEKTSIKLKKIKLHVGIQRNDKKNDDSIFYVNNKKENVKKKISLEKSKGISFFNDKGNTTTNNNNIKEKHYRSSNSRFIQLKNKINSSTIERKINNFNNSFGRIRKSRSLTNLSEEKSSVLANINDKYIYTTKKDFKKCFKRNKTDITVSRVNNNSNFGKTGNNFNDINNNFMNNENNNEIKKKKKIINQNLNIYDIDLCEQNDKDKTYMSSIMYKYIKLCDFNSSIKLKENYKYFSYVCSRYYRAPELLFGSNYYSQEIDTWSIGCVMGELILGKPLFLGDCASDQLVEIIKILGTPNDEDFLSFRSVYKNVKFPDIKPITLKKLINHNCSKDSIDLLSKLLQFNPKKRIKLCNALLHNYFDDIRNLKVFKVFNKQISSDNNFSLPYNTNCFNFTKEELLHFTVEERKILIPLEVRRKKIDEVKQYINMSLENFDKLYPNKIHLTC
ncbi:protein kinase 1, putative [Plasmodium relictum]|uniref:Protein kinase 1, putative n=1 Tax=Plasmodium relictum TaxID=85471 RepID=A0A1J1H277_PLARL|nr:protein kinase 1, putative [Plasmodium relictum]CRG98870.1 protein kinase 1, putative [Plasmodium relictum]